MQCSVRFASQKKKSEGGGKSILGGGFSVCCFSSFKALQVDVSQT